MIRIRLKSYLEDLRSIENRKPKENQRQVPSLADIARQNSIHYTSISRFANNRTKRIDFDALDGIIKSIRFYGFPMTISDLIDFVPDDNLKNDRDTVWSRLERRELPNLAELRQETESLETLVAGITEENRHDEIDFGPPVGEEIW